MKPNSVRNFPLYLFFPAFLFLCLLLNTACTPPTASKQQLEKFYKYKISEVEFDLGDKENFEFFDVHFDSDGQDRLLVRYNKKKISNGENLGIFLRLSEDGGKTFGKEYKVRDIFDIGEKIKGFAFYLIPKGFAVLINSKRNLYYSQSQNGLENWNEFTQINDEQDSFYRIPQLLQTSEKEIYCVWNDNRRNFTINFFSASFDGGKTWTSNQPIDFDYRQGDQRVPQLIRSENGRLHIFWQDNRDRKTLYDIRYSYSDDKGKNWVPSIKINDDEEEVWQNIPTVVADGSNIYVAFTDFRDPGVENDGDWNIYFARSTDNGMTWDKNKRINDVKKGRDGLPKLRIDEKGNLYLVWTTTRNTLFGQFAFTYSKDKGDTWSPSILLTKPEEMIWLPVLRFQPFSNDKFLFSWIKNVDGKAEFVHSILEKTSDLIDPGELKQKTETQNPEPLKYKSGEILFSDDFSGEKADKWEEESGVWDILDGTYRGVNPNSNKSFISFAKFKEPVKYIMRGRFKLDGTAHYIASIYFRRDKNNLKHYVISNRFRHGVWLSVKDNDLPIGSHASGGTPLVQKAFPFRQDRWYKFTLVVTPEQVDYYIDDRLMLSLKEKLIFPAGGKIGIGGYIPAPTYFDDISISELTE